MRICCGYGVEVDEVATWLGEGVDFSRHTWPGFELRASRFIIISQQSGDACVTQCAMDAIGLIAFVVPVSVDKHITIGLVSQNAVLH